MTKTQKKMILTAAVAGLVAGAAIKAANATNNDKGQNLAGKPVSGDAAYRATCNGCPGHTNRVSGN